jgi:hypothetical protein
MGGNTGILLVLFGMYVILLGILVVAIVVSLHLRSHPTGLISMMEIGLETFGLAKRPQPAWGQTILSSYVCRFAMVKSL